MYDGRCSLHQRTGPATVTNIAAAIAQRGTICRRPTGCCAIFVRCMKDTGNCDAAFGTASYGGPLGFIAHTLATIPGDAYNLILWERSEWCCSNSFEIKWDGNVLLNRHDTITHDYVRYEFDNLVASSDSTVLRIGA